MRVLVTGGAGYVGSVSVEAFVAAGHDVVVLDDLSSGHAAAVPSGVRLERFSYGDGDAVGDLLERERVDTVLHCAARSLVPESVRDPARYYRENVAGGVALLEAIRRSGVRRVVFSSTAATYGDPEVSPIEEDHPLKPINPYGETKRTFEAALRWYGEAYGLRSVTLRYFNAAGATERNGEDHEPETHLIPNVLRAVRGEGEVTVFGDDYPTPDGTCVRDFIHVADLADAHLLALEATAPDDDRTGPPDGPSRQLVCNLGTGGGHSVMEVLRTVERITGRDAPHRIGPRRPGDPPVLVASSARAADVLGWRPRRSSLDAVIGSAWTWLERHPRGYGD